MEPFINFDEIFKFFDKKQEEDYGQIKIAHALMAHALMEEMNITFVDAAAIVQSYTDQFVSYEETRKLTIAILKEYDNPVQPFIEVQNDSHKNDKDSEFLVKFKNPLEAYEDSFYVTNSLEEARLIKKFLVFKKFDLHVKIVKEFE